jgi:hypothetical protein
MSPSPLSSPRLRAVLCATLLLTVLPWAISAAAPVSALAAQYKRAHNCPAALLPPPMIAGDHSNYPFFPFRSEFGQQGCCLLDRAIGAMELMHNVHSCTVFHRHIRGWAGGHDVIVDGSLWEELPAEP